MEALARLEKIKVGCFQGEIQEKYAIPPLLQALARIDELIRSEGAEILVESRNRVVVVPLPLTDDERADIVVKEFKPRCLEKLRTFLAGSRARRSFSGALALLERGIGTAEPVAYLEKKDGFRSGGEYFLARRISGAEEVRFLFRHLPLESLEHLLVALASTLRHVHHLGILHRDLSDGNILARQRDSGSWDFYFLDTNRIRLKKKIGRWRGLKSLIRLGIPDHLQTFFLKAYLESSHLSLLSWLWYRSLKIIYTSWIRTKKALRLRALARFLRLQ